VSVQCPVVETPQVSHVGIRRDEFEAVNSEISSSPKTLERGPYESHESSDRTFELFGYLTIKEFVFQVASPSWTEPDGGVPYYPVVPALCFEAPSHLVSRL
jgi:hypothetical protein